MFTLARAKKAMGAAGEPLPTVFESLARQTLHIRRGQLTLVASGPGVGKSVFSQTLAMKGDVPTLYGSFDSDAFTMYLRGAAIVSGHRLQDIESDYEKGNGQFYDQRLNRMRHVRFDYTQNPSPDDLEETSFAFAQAYGEFPHLIIVDNLMNVDGGMIGGEKSGDASVLQFLKTMAHETNAAVVVLHHLVGNYDDGNTPAPMSALINKVSKLPETILTLYRTGIANGTATGMGVCIVKNRGGKADAAGGLIVDLEYAPDYARLEDIKR